MLPLWCPDHSAAVREAIAADTLAAELKSFGASVWTAKSVNVLKHVWSARGDTVCAAVKGLAFDVLNIGKVRPPARPARRGDVCPGSLMLSALLQQA